MNGEIKKYIYIISGVFVLFLAVWIFLNILPWILLVGALAYIVIKVVKFIKARKEEKRLDRPEEYNKDKYNYNDQSDDYTTGEIIDVEYEDVDNNKH